MSVESLYEQGFAMRCDGRYGEAKAILLQALELDSTHTESKWQLALIQGFEGDFDGSLTALQGLSIANPAHLDIRYDLAMTYMMLGFVDEACAEFKNILAQDPGHEKARQQAVYC